MAVDRELTGRYRHKPGSNRISNLCRPVALLRPWNRVAHKVAQRRVVLTSIARLFHGLCRKLCKLVDCRERVHKDSANPTRELQPLIKLDGFCRYAEVRDSG